jgi:hypothetical protein
MANKLTVLVKKITELRETMKREGKEALKEAFVEFFDKHPEAKEILWTQYTPYFNDGDACTFSKHSAELKVYPSKVAEDVAKLLGINSEDNLDGDESDYGYGESCAADRLESLKDFDADSRWDRCKRMGVEHRALTASEKSLVKDFRTLDKNLDSISEVLETVLGDHCLVRATRDGFEVTEYDHD